MRRFSLEILKTVGDAGGKAKEILDQRRRSGLSARRVAFQNHSFEPFGRGINRGSETSWTRTDDGKIARDFALVLARDRPDIPATCATSRNDGRRSGMPFALISGSQVATSHVQALAQGPPIFAPKKLVSTFGIAPNFMDV
jgi:hypothetical protein